MQRSKVLSFELVLYVNMLSTSLILYPVICLTIQRLTEESRDAVAGSDRQPLEADGLRGLCIDHELQAMTADQRSVMDHSDSMHD